MSHSEVAQLVFAQGPTKSTKGGTRGIASKESRGAAYITCQSNAPESYRAGYDAHSEVLP